MVKTILDKPLLLTSLYRIGNELGKKRFLSMLKKPVCRFPNMTSSVFNKLMGDCLYQLRSHIHYESRKAYRAERGQEDIHLEYLLATASKDIISLADAISVKEYITVLKRDRNYTIRQSNNSENTPYLSLINTLFNSDIGLCSFVNSYSFRKDESRVTGFDVGCILSEMSNFITSLDTLAFDTGLERYEKILLSLPIDEGFWSGSSYPKDILCHDRNIFINECKRNNPIQSVAINKEYASSRVCYAKDEIDIDVNLYHLHRVA